MTLYSTRSSVKNGDITYWAVSFPYGTAKLTPGAVVSYKIYVQLTTGNEAGSEPVSVERPV